MGKVKLAASHGSEIMGCQSEIEGPKLNAGVSGYQSTILSCIVRHCHQAMTTKDIENLVFAAGICRLCRLVRAL
jgi:hypothetical protein